jgi:hypothetical protein
VKQLEQFLNLCDSASAIYHHDYKLVGHCDKLTGDFLHALELDDLTTNDRSKLATRQRQNLLARRVAKDAVSLWTPFVKIWLESPSNQKALEYLRKTLENTKSIEAKLNSRTYVKRVEDQGG